MYIAAHFCRHFLGAWLAHYGNGIVWLDLFFCKKLNLVVNKQDQRTMKTALKIFLAFWLF